MTAIVVAMTAFACVFGGAWVGMVARTRLPEQHLSNDAKDVIRLGMALIATMTALVLGLMIATAKSSYDAQQEAVKHSAVKILVLDHALAKYGPETRPVRELLRRTVAARLEAIWTVDRFQRPALDSVEAALAGEDIVTGIMALSPQSEVQRDLRSIALDAANDISQTRWLVLGGSRSSIPLPFLVVVVFWLTTIFASFGLFAPRNATVIAVLVLCSLSAAASIFVIFELDAPFEGLIRISSDPLRYALLHLAS